MVGEDDGGGVGGGGGKLRKRRGRTGAAKPYDRPQSILNRVGNAVRGVLNPLGLSWFQPWNQVETVPEDDEDDEYVVSKTTSETRRHVFDNRRDAIDCPIVATSRSALNSLSSTATFDTMARHTQSTTMNMSSVAMSDENGPKFKEQYRVPITDGMDTASTSIWNPVNESGNRNSNQSFRISTTTTTNNNTADAPRSSTSKQFSSEFDDGAVPSTSAGSSFASPNPVAFMGSASQINQRRQSFSTSSSSRNNFARLFDNGKLSNDLTTRRGLEGNSKLDGGDSQSECSDESVSTSGCSSMVPHPDKRDYQRDILQLSKPALHQLSANLQAGLRSSDTANIADCNRIDDDDMIMSANSSRSQGRQNEGELSARASPFLFSESMSSHRARPQPMPTTKRPQFNSFLFGSPTLTDKSDLRGNNSFAVSYPYVNKVSYGFGSSSRPMSRPSSTAPYNASGRRQIQVKPLNMANADLMSPTARKILETLETMSTPIMDAKRIPSSKHDPILDTPLTFTTTAYRRRPNLSMRPTTQVERIETNTTNIVSGGPPVGRLMTPGSTAVTRGILRNVDAPLSQEAQNASPSSSERPPTNTITESLSLRDVDHTTKNNVGGKMRVPRQNAGHYSRALADNDIPEAPQFQSVPLNINTLPKFDFLKSNNASWSSSNMGSSVTSRNSERETINIGPCQFSSPIVKEAIDCAMDTLDKQKTVSQFTFSSPLSVDEHESANIDPMELSKPERQSSGASIVNSKFSPASMFNVESSGGTSTSGNIETTIAFKTSSAVKPALKLKAPEDDDELVENKLKAVGGFAVATELKTGSVMDFLMKSKTDQKSGSSIASEAKAVSTTSGFGERFKPAIGSWECPSCMLSNNVDASKCIACETRKPISNHKPDATKAGPVSVSTFVGFGDKFKPAAGSWECPGCMLRVDKDKIKCDTCETPRPAVSSQNSFGNVKSPASITSFSGTDTFKPPALPTSAAWVCDTCLVRNVSSALQCAACEFPKPGSQPAKAPGTFKFGFEPSSNSATAAITTQTTMKFGFPSTAAAVATTSSVTSTTPAFKFGISSSTSATTTSTTPSISSFVPKSDPSISASSSDSKAPTAFKFGLAGATKKPDKDKAESSSANAFKMPSSSTLVAAAVTTAADKSLISASQVVDVDDDIVEVTSKSTTGVAEKSASLNFVAGSNNPSTLRNSSPVVASGFISEKTTPTNTSSSTALNNSETLFKSPYSFGSAKPLIEKPSATPTTAGNTQQSGGFNFKFGSTEGSRTSAQSQLPTTTESVATAVSATPTFSFGTPPLSTKSTSGANGGSNWTSVTTSQQPAVTTAGFPFTFGSPTGTKRSADDNADIADPSKKIASSGGATFLFGSGGTQQVSATPTPIAGFSFGTVPVTRSQPASGPIFGALSTTSDKSPSSNTFTFGANSSASPSLPSFGATQTFGSAAANKSATPTQLGTPQVPITQTSLGFNFKQTASTTVTTASSTFPTFSFGSQTTPSANNARATTTNTNNNVGVFGASALSTPAPATSTTLAFGSGVGSQQSMPMFAAQSSSVAASPAFGSFAAPASSSSIANSGFGANSAIGMGVAVVPTNPTSFSFGSTPAPATAGFQFGASASQDAGVFTFTGNQANANTGFTFGQQQQQNQQQPGVAPASGFNFNPANQLNFNFGSATGTANQPPIFNAPQNPFDVLGSANRAPGRPIKKAKRRTQK